MSIIETIEQIGLWATLLGCWYIGWLWLKNSVEKTIDEAFEPLVKVLDNFNKEINPEITKEDCEKIAFIETYELQERFSGQYTNVPYEELSKKDQQDYDEIRQEIKNNTKQYRQFKNEVGNKQYTTRYNSWRNENKHLVQYL